MEPPATKRSLTCAMEPPAKKRSLTRQLTVERSAAEAMMKKGQSETLSGTAFKDGSLLGDLARSHVISFREVLPDNHKPMSGRRTWGSLCSVWQLLFTYKAEPQHRSRSRSHLC